MNQEKIINDGKDFINQIFATDSSGHDADHSLRVYKTALEIAATEPKTDTFLVSLASLLHDVDDFKLFPNNINYQNARSFMTKENIPSDIQEKVIHIISQVSYKCKDTVTPDTLEGKIVTDADRLDAIGAIGIARAFAYGGAHNRKLYDKNDQDCDPNKSYGEYRKHSSSTIAHFYEKLLHLKDLMNTKEGKRIAKKRHAFLIEFLKEFDSEVSSN
ncbi:MAG: HD domain-containing protein [Bacilli bacterium]|jgi:uncharacterized protein